MTGLCAPWIVFDPEKTNFPIKSPLSFSSKMYNQLTVSILFLAIVNGLAPLEPAESGKIYLQVSPFDFKLIFCTEGLGMNG